MTLPRLKFASTHPKKFLYCRGLKRFASILLLGTLAFNWFGYRMLTGIMEQKAQSRLESQLDNEAYDPAELISIKVPAQHLSYYNMSGSFERVDGRVEMNGIQYKYVKRRLYNDSVELLCIPDQMAMKLQSAKDEFFKLVNDLQQNGRGKKTGSHANVSKNFTTDVCIVTEPIYLYQPGFATSQTYPPVNTGIVYRYKLTAERPPDTIA